LNSLTLLAILQSTIRVLSFPSIKVSFKVSKISSRSDTDNSSYCSKSLSKFRMSWLISDFKASEVFKKDWSAMKSTLLIQTSFSNGSLFWSIEMLTLELISKKIWRLSTLWWKLPPKRSLLSRSLAKMYIFYDIERLCWFHDQQASWCQIPQNKKKLPKVMRGHGLLLW